MLKGTFSITKTVKGLKTDKEFSFNYACSGGITGTLKVRAGETVNGSELRHGTECVISEHKDSAKVAGYKVSVPEAQKVTVDSTEVAKAEFVNTYTKVVKPKLPVTGVNSAILLGVSAVALALGILMRRRLS